MSAAELINTREGWSPEDESGAPQMFPGIVGELVRLAEPHTEASAAAVASQFVVLFGNAVGSGPYFSIAETRHHLNENLLIVGESAVARKGDGYNIARAPFQIGDPEWKQNRIKGGLATGEGLIHAVRDRRMGLDKNGVEEIQDEGVADRRLMIMESEFANLLKVAARDSNTLTGVVRLAWDGNEPLSNLSKGAAEQATDAHVSMIGHATPADLTQYLSSTEMANGFANRIMMLSTKRARFIPNPTSLPRKQLDAIGQKLKKLIERAKLVKEIKRSPEADRLWVEVYRELSTPPPGLLGMLLSRGAPHVVRLSMIYALLGGSTKEIGVEHVASALAFWEVVTESTRRIFSDRTGNREADKIREKMEPGDEYTITDLREKVFAGNIHSDKLRAACTLLESYGEFRMDMERNTKGRPREVLVRLTTAEARKKRSTNGSEELGEESHTFSPFSVFSVGQTNS